MIRRFLHLDASPATVTALFHDLERWPEWVAGVRSARILEGGPERVRVEMVQTQMGRTVRQLLDCRLASGFLDQHQVTGPFRRWDLRWRFMPPPEGAGTTVTMELELDLGGLGMMVPSRMIHGAIDQMCARSVAAARERLGAGAAGAASAPVDDGETARLLAAVRAGERIVLEIAGRRYRLEPEVR